jgi:hypothetical protein
MFTFHASQARWGCQFFVVATFGLAACGASNEGVGSGGSNSGNPNAFDFPSAGSDGGLLPGSGTNSGRDPGADPEKICGLETIPLERLPAELLLVLDRSSSMVRDRLSNNQSHWQVTTEAVDTAVQNTQGGVLWGLKMFPSRTGCGVRDGVEQDVALNNHGPINMAVRGATPPQNANGTPTTDAMKAATAYLAARTTPNPKYILLATDGEPTCLNGNANVSALDTPAALQSISDAAAAGFHTFVVGIAAQRQEGRALATLNDMAEAGKQPRAGDTKFYSVSSQDELSTALRAIAGQVGSCAFNLSKAPPSPDDVAVDVDGKRVIRSATDGWQYGPNGTSIILNGPLCDKARAGELKDVRITLGCPGMVLL